MTDWEKMCRKEVEDKQQMPCGRGRMYRFYYEIFQENAQQDKADKLCSLISPQRGAGALDAGS